MPPFTLARYILIRLLIAVGALYLALAALIILVDFIESLRFASKIEDAGLGFAAQITLFRTPALTQALAPFIFLFAGLWMFSQLNRRSELAVMRSAGMSIWRLINPAALVAMIAGLAIVLVIDPAASHLTASAERMKDDIRGKRSSLLQVFGDGIWLRQREDSATLLINAAVLREQEARLDDITVWRIANRGARAGTFLERIDAPRGRLSGRAIILEDARLLEAGAALPRRMPTFTVPTGVTVADFRDNAPPPETMSIWDLPRYVRLAQAAGLPTVRYDIRFHELWSTPLKLIAMTLIAALFSFRPARSGGGLQLLSLAIGVGFILYFLSEIARAMGESGAAPPFLAGWTPALIATIAAVTGLLHIEDG